ncbi:hypothetical protein [Noviherbaspirillum malthae]|jgi:hypothetical protein|uniref:hypothetical protein n=1 Tax=Noviherbaspirillum malthae TaxID=1260987 RepID=UPI00188F08C0|nr:hypothetical protein [Noviherbaspirillum malthae]
MSRFSVSIVTLIETNRCFREEKVPWHYANKLLKKKKNPLLKRDALPRGTRLAIHPASAVS